MRAQQGLIGIVPRNSYKMLWHISRATQRCLHVSSTALLPPKVLYRRVLRAHRKHLPAQSRQLGDNYVKSEFRLHRNVDNPAQLIGFLTEWQLYAQKVEENSWAGDKLDQNFFDKMNEEQQQQVSRLLHANQKRNGSA
ncbi:acetate non-utilizing protein 9, mitochondrial [Ophiocordyceps camponoti-floridani]|uniref:Succinate dehydrogenase assembly factor 3 n=1 Tax=Ophiocordyceps camponoti-floridani TaxID=2030778 RepID=A0A8H4QBV0_9HYPO|nr:acetate non-utilizing protein 9, mitochondrial [Ophiocordyceps camponoti-floridani]